MDTPSIQQEQPKIVDNKKLTYILAGLAILFGVTSLMLFITIQSVTKSNKILSRNLEETERNIQITSSAKEKLMEQVSNTDAKCVDLRGNVKSTNDPNTCQFEVIYGMDTSETRGYSFYYPSTWVAEARGAAAASIKVSGEKGLFISFTPLTRTILPLQNYDRATWSYELSEPKPFIDKTETIINKKQIKIGNKEVLFVQSRDSEDNEKKYYFFDDSGTEYKTLFVLKTSLEDTYNEDIYRLIKSFSFVPGTK